MTMTYDEGFYDEPNEFDRLMDELKSSLSKAVKNEWTQELERLRAENAELQDVKANFAAIHREHARQMRELESQRLQAKDEARRERLSSLFHGMDMAMYGVHGTWVKGEKCDRCDQYRQVHYTTPLGRQAVENCTCDKRWQVFSPKVYVCYEITPDAWGKKLSLWYYATERDGGELIKLENSSIGAEVVYTAETPFETLDEEKTLFRTEAECQAYCEYLNGLSGGKS